MTIIWRPRCSRGHYLPSKDVHTTLGPEDWDDTCRCKTSPQRREPSTETFGHEPVWADFGTCVIDVGACTCPYHDEDLACARCRRDGKPVLWPCTSAHVLDLTAP